MNTVSVSEMRQIDKRAIEEYGISVERLMENAGYQVAEFLRNNMDEKEIAIYVGKGHNGGDALSAARRLHNWGYNIEVILATRELEGVARDELEMLKNMDVEIREESSSGKHEIALDGLIGYSIEGDPRPPFDSMIEEINGHEKI
jgi:Uncharacterized conserved protein